VAQNNPDEANGLPGDADDTDLVTTVEGPSGTAEVYEVFRKASGGDMVFAYEVRFRDGAETFQSLGEAYATAGQRVGVRT
jgi:hypothetical protein